MRWLCPILGCLLASSISITGCGQHNSPSAAQLCTVGSEQFLDMSTAILVRAKPCHALGATLSLRRISCTAIAFVPQILGSQRYGGQRWARTCWQWWMASASS